MKNIIYIIVNYGSHFLFLVLEVVCFFLIINYNQGQKDIFINSTNLVATRINSQVDKVSNYLELETINDSLQIQNARLLQRFINTDINRREAADSLTLDSIQYLLIPSKICNSTFRLKNNSLTLCNGSNDGLDVGMGVISKNGVIGQITAISDNYARVMSLLHSQSRISAVVKGTNAFGTIRWPGGQPNLVRLEGIPSHINVSIGDTVTTSGFSTLFPKGLSIGKVVGYKESNSTYTIEVKLSHDPSKLDVPYVIKNQRAQEQLALELQTND